MDSAVCAECADGETVFSWNQTLIWPSFKAGNHALVSVEEQTRLMAAQTSKKIPAIAYKWLASCFVFIISVIIQKILIIPTHAAVN
jgi:hypothetical protein